jgi:signal transduction histidine kinase
MIPALEREIREATVRRERRQALEDLKRAIEVRDEFLTIASHELKTPITALVLVLQRSLDMLRGRNLFEVSLDALETKVAHAIRQADRLTVLINHLLDVTRFASGRPTIATKSVDLCEIVRNVVSNIPASLRGASELRITGLSSLVGDWDPAGLEMILSHLILNAAKFGEGKPIEISIERSGERTRVTVTDRGIGIAREDQARIFERFGRAVPSRHYGGFGLGLWITKLIAEAHGGTVDVSSQPGEGASFRVELPMARVENG